MEQDESAIEAVRTDSVRSLLETLRDDDAETGSAVRLVFRYEGDDREVLHVRDDVDQARTDAELERRIDTLTMKGLGDPRQEGALHDFGRLQATVRWFEDAVCVHLPDDEWAGVVIVLDRVEAPLVDVALEHLD